MKNFFLITYAALTTLILASSCVSEQKVQKRLKLLEISMTNTYNSFQTVATKLNQQTTINNWLAEQYSKTRVMIINTNDAAKTNINGKLYMPVELEPKK